MKKAFEKLKTSPDFPAKLPVQPLYLQLAGDEFFPWVVAGFDADDGNGKVWEYTIVPASRRLAAIRTYQTDTSSTNPARGVHRGINEISLSGNEIAPFETALPKFREWTVKARETQPAPFDKVLPVEIRADDYYGVREGSVAKFIWKTNSAAPQGFAALSFKLQNDRGWTEPQFSPEQAEELAAALQFSQQALECLNKVTDLWTQEVREDALEMERTFD